MRSLGGGGHITCVAWALVWRAYNVCSLGTGMGSI